MLMAFVAIIPVVAIGTVTLIASALTIIVTALAVTVATSATSLAVIITASATSPSKTLLISSSRRHSAIFSSKKIENTIHTLGLRQLLSAIYGHCDDGIHL